MSPKLSETIEVEDIVSADTNQFQGGVTNRFQSYHTSSNMFNQGADAVARNDTPDATYGTRINNDSGLQTASVKGINDNTPNNTTMGDRLDTSEHLASQNKRSANVKSSMAMTPSHKFEALAAQDNVAESVEVKEKENTGRERTARVTVPINAKDNEYAEYREMHRMSQNGGSSIVDSQVTETDKTNQSEAGKIDKQIDTLHDSTIHEDTIDAWKVQIGGAVACNGAASGPDMMGNFAESPDITDENATVGEHNSQIGDGPIYIKKSTDYHATTGRRIKYMGSQSSLEQTEFGANTMNSRRMGTMIVRDSAAGLQRAQSRQVSDITQQTEQIRPKHNIKQGQAI